MLYWGRGLINFATYNIWLVDNMVNFKSTPLCQWSQSNMQQFEMCLVVFFNVETKILIMMSLSKTWIDDEDFFPHAMKEDNSLVKYFLPEPLGKLSFNKWLCIITIYGKSTACNTSNTCPLCCKLQNRHWITCLMNRQIVK